MTAEEKTEIERLLTKLSNLVHGRAEMTIHSTANVFAILVGEIDEAIEKARRDLSAMPLEGAP